MRQSIRYLRNGAVHEISGFAPDRTLLDYLREDCRATGTKEGCAEGDCGACTVVLGRSAGGRVEYRAINACIQPLGSLDGCELVTVEDLAGRDGALHPVQQALVAHHASQCGFCTPGFVMALFALYHERGGPVSRRRVNDAIAGNLCRCTGYRPIVAAGLEACAQRPRDTYARQARATVAALDALASDDSLFVGTKERFFAAPQSEDELAKLSARHPDATLVAGATDVGLWITKGLRDLRKIIHLGAVKGLDTIKESKTTLKIGATATYSDAYTSLALLDPDIGELLRRIGSEQIRNAGTIGGNIANGSPIGDMPPLLIALGARLELRKGAKTRTIPLEDFFIAYGRQDRAPGEYVRMIHVPKPAKGAIFRCFKLSKRFDQDISGVMGAFYLRPGKDGRIVSARIAFGGMAATPKRALRTEAALKGAIPAELASWQGALATLGEDFAPLSDHRASADYRLHAARGLLHKVMAEAADTGVATRLEGLREAVHD